MPTSTFNKLSDDKKKLLEKAAIKEFSNYTYDDVSINRIIREIRMPRGSFYLYFENKEDLYLYIMDKYVINYINNLGAFIRQNNGDIILSYEYAFDKVVDYCKNGINAKLVSHFLRGLTHRIDVKTKELNRQKALEQIFVDINSDYFVDDSKDNLFYVFDLLTNTLIHSLIEYLVLEVDINLIKKKYYAQLKIIRKGIYKVDIC